MTHGDTDFVGKGRVRCRICGKPVAKHEIGRCPEADDDPDLFRGPRSNRTRRTQAEIEQEKKR